MIRRFWWISMLFALSAMAQQDTAAPKLMEQHRFTVEAYGGYDSNVLYNDLITGLYRGGTLGTEVLEHSQSQMGDANRAGYLLFGKATYAWGDSLFGHARWMPRFSLAFQSAMGMRFAKDAYTLSFFGNSIFEGETAQLGPGDLHQVTFQTFSFGLEDRHSGSFIEISLVNGSSLNDAHITKADLFTAEDGRYLELQVDGKYQRSDTADNSPSRGIGAAINFAWRKSFTLFGSPASLAVGLNDLGFIAWNGNAQSVEKDSTIRYEGIAVTDILHLDGLVLNSGTLQDSLGLGYENARITTVLPAQVEGRLLFGKLRRQVHHPGAHAYAIELDQRYLPGYVPHVSLTRNFALSRALITSIGAGYGGFGGLRAVLGFDAFIANSLRIGVYTPNAIGLCSNNAQGKALGARMALTW